MVGRRNIESIDPKASFEEKRCYHINRIKRNKWSLQKILKFVKYKGREKEKYMIK